MALEPQLRRAHRPSGGTVISDLQAGAQEDPDLRKLNTSAAGVTFEKNPQRAQNLSHGLKITGHRKEALDS